MNVKISGLHKGFGTKHPVLRGVSLEVPQGTFTAVLGPSGSGKTTLLRAVAGFGRPESGAIEIGGRVVDGAGVFVPPSKRGIGYVPQEGSLFPHLDIAANIGFGLPRGQRGARTAELLELIGMPDLGHRYPHQLSGGQQQRVALARALAVRPKVLLLDEPLSALDAKVRLQLRDEIRRIQQEFGITTLFVTHDQEEALSMADRVAVMKSGRLEQCAAPAELYERPATAFVAQFVGTMNHLPGKVVADGKVRVAGRELPIDGPHPAPGTAVKVLIRPEGLDLEPRQQSANGNNASAEANIDADAEAGEGQVVLGTFLGATTRLTVRLADGVEAKADLPSHRAAEFPVGAVVQLAPAPRPVLVVDEAQD